MLKTISVVGNTRKSAYHLGEGRVLKTMIRYLVHMDKAYHLGEGRVLKTKPYVWTDLVLAYHLGEGRVLKTFE